MCTQLSNRYIENLKKNTFQCKAHSHLDAAFYWSLGVQKYIVEDVYTIQRLFMPDKTIIRQIFFYNLDTHVFNN